MNGRDLSEKKSVRRSTVFDKPDKTLEFSKYSAALQRMKIYEEKQMEQNTTEYDKQRKRKTDIQLEIAKMDDDIRNDSFVISKTCEKSIKKMSRILMKSGRSEEESNARLYFSNSLNKILQMVVSGTCDDQMKEYKFELESMIVATDRQLKDIDKKSKEIDESSPEISFLMNNYNKLKEQYDNLEPYIQTGAEFEMTELKSRIKELQDNVNAITNDIKETKEVILNNQAVDETTCEEIVDPLKKYISYLDNEIADKNAEIRALKESNESGRMELDDLNQQIAALEAEIGDLSGKLTK